MKEFFKNDAVDIDAIREVENEMKISFPTSYIDFLLQSNGGEGSDENNRYIYIWRCEDIPQYNKDYSVHNYFPKDIIAFGMDGDCGYFFDFRVSSEPQIVSCEFGDLDIAEIKQEAKVFDEFISSYI